MQRKGKLSKNPEIVQYAEELRGRGYSWRDIADKLYDEMGFKVTHIGLQKFFDRKGQVTQQMLQSNEELRAEVEEEIVNTKEELKSIREKLWDIVESDESGGTKIKGLNSLIKMLEFQSKMLGQMNEQNVQNQQNISVYNYTDMSVHLHQKLQSLEDQGYITIHKKLPTQEMEEEMENRQ